MMTISSWSFAGAFFLSSLCLSLSFFSSCFSSLPFSTPSFSSHFSSRSRWWGVIRHADDDNIIMELHALVLFSLPSSIFPSFSCFSFLCFSLDPSFSSHLGLGSRWWGGGARCHDGRAEPWWHDQEDEGRRRTKDCRRTSKNQTRSWRQATKRRGMCLCLCKVKEGDFSCEKQNHSREHWWQMDRRYKEEGQEGKSRTWKQTESSERNQIGKEHQDTYFWTPEPGVIQDELRLLSLSVSVLLPLLFVSFLLFFLVFSSFWRYSLLPPFTFLIPFLLSLTWLFSLFFSSFLLPSCSSQYLSKFRRDSCFLCWFLFVCFALWSGG